MAEWQEMQDPVERSQEDIEQERLERAQANQIDIELESDDAPADKPKKLVPKKLVKKAVAPSEDPEDLDIDVEDDTPAKDRGRGAAAAPPDVTDEELEGYSAKVKKRMSHLMRGYHDERRVKEQALRERQAAEEFAQAQLKKTKELEARLQELQTTAQTATKGQIESQLEQARKTYREAYEVGDADALEKANDRVIELRMQLAEAARTPVATPTPADTPLQEDKDTVYSSQQPVQRAPVPDQKAIAWQVENSWYGQDPLMTQFAQGVHLELVVDKKLDTKSDAYYEALNKRVRQAFPDYDWASDNLEDEQPEPAETRRAEKKPATVVAGASRSTPTRKVKLTTSQVAIARRLGVSLEEYARQVADLTNGGR